MQICNPIKLNDWEIWKLFIVVLGFQIGVPGFTLLYNNGFITPFLMPTLSFVYFFFIPGILILRILKIHRRSTSQTLLYAVGLSIGSMMFIGCIMNTLYPIIDITEPLSSPSLLVTLNAVIWLLFAGSYHRDKRFVDPSYINIHDFASKSAALLYLIPLLTIVGVHLVNNYQQNLLLTLVIALIAVVAVLIAFGRLIPHYLYPLAILSISISLLLHTSLISPYIWGADIHAEYYQANLVLSHSYWDYTLPGNVNAMLSIVILAPMFTEISTLCLTEVFKTMYPLLFALAPLGIYQAFKSLTDETVAFLGTFFFVSSFTFYTELVVLPRQAIAEIFLVLMIMLMLDDSLTRKTNFTLYMIFGASMVVSHYGLTYIYMFAIAAVWVMLMLSHSPRVHQFTDWATARFRPDAAASAEFLHRLETAERRVTVWHVVTFVLLVCLWNSNIAGGTAIETIQSILQNIRSDLFTGFLNPESAQGLEIIIKEISTPLRGVAKYLHIMTLIFIIAGFISLCIQPWFKKIRGEFFAFSLVALLFAIAGIAVPHVASSIETSRLYQITLIFLSLFCVVGGLALLQAVTTQFRKLKTDHRMVASTRAIAVIFAVLFLFNSGWIYECVNDYPTSIALSQNSIINYNQNENLRNRFYANYIPEYDVRSAIWLSQMRDPDLLVYADRTRREHVLHSYGSFERQYLLLTNSSPCAAPGAYVYLGSFNVIENHGSGPERKEDVWNMDDIRLDIAFMKKVYSNGGSDIYINRR